MKILRFLHPKSASPDDYRRELILNVILGFCIAITFLFFLMVLNNALRHQSRIGLLNFLAITSPIGAAYVLSRKGRIFAASCVTVAFFSFGLLYSAYAWVPYSRPFSSESPSSAPARASSSIAGPDSHMRSAGARLSLPWSSCADTASTRRITHGRASRLTAWT